MPTFNTFITVLAVDIIVEVDYHIVNAGSGPTYSPIYGAEGGDDPEIEILSITKVCNGEDITDWCGKTKSFDKDTWMMMISKADEGWQDKVRTAMFGWPDHYATTDPKPMMPYRLTIEVNSASYMELIEAKIIASQEFADACAYRGDDFD